MKRREFLRNGVKIGLASSALPMIIGGVPMQVFGKAPKLPGESTQSNANGHVLVLIQLQGGNDGLNCLVPITDPNYMKLRPNLGINSSAYKLLPLADHPTLAWHYKLPLTASLYASKRLTILQNVGCPLPDLSHFRATDMYETATDGNIYLSTGWVGRMLEEQNPNYSPSTIKAGSDPLALHFGQTVSKIFTAPVLPVTTPFTTIEMGVAANKLPTADNVTTQNIDPIPANPQQAYQTLQYVRTVQQDTEIYNTVLANRAVQANKVTYPQTTFAQQLASVAQLIASGMTTKIYVVTQSGYDFHSALIPGQEANHFDLDNALYAFQNDLEALGIADKVITMTYSEFGRRPSENGSGTDHGTSYPLFVMGTSVKGGTLGNDPDLVNLIYGNLNYDPLHDFRNIYATMMGEWLGLDDTTIEHVLTSSNGITYSTAGNWQKLNLFKVAGVEQPTPSSASQFGLVLMQNHPNPFFTSTKLAFAVPKQMNVRLSVYNVAGEEVSRLVDGTLSAGTHEATFNANNLPSGVYFYRLITAETQLTRQMTLLR